MGDAQPPATRSGPGTILITLYGFFAVAATSRALVQLVRRFDEAPVAYLLSAVAAIVYVVATVALFRGTPRWRRVAYAALIFEFAGVLVVGTLSVVDADLFPRATVWSHFGSGYYFVPLVLPLLGLSWLVRTRPRAGGQA